MSGASHPSLGYAGVAAERGRLSATVGVRAEGQGHSPCSRCQSGVGRNGGLSASTCRCMCAQSLLLALYLTARTRGGGTEGGQRVAKCMTAVFVEGVRHAFAEASNSIKHDRQNVKGPVWMIYCGCVVHCECLQDCLRARRAAVHAALLPKQASSA